MQCDPAVVAPMLPINSVLGPCLDQNPHHEHFPLQGFRVGVCNYRGDCSCGLPHPSGLNHQIIFVHDHDILINLYSILILISISISILISILILILILTLLASPWPLAVVLISFSRRTRIDARMILSGDLRCERNSTLRRDRTCY